MTLLVKKKLVNVADVNHINIRFRKGCNGYFEVFKKLVAVPSDDLQHEVDLESIGELVKVLNDLAGKY